MKRMPEILAKMWYDFLHQTPVPRSILLQFLIAFLLTSLVPLSLVTVLQISKFTRTLEMEARQKLEAAANYSALSIEAFLDRNIRHLEVAARLPEITRFVPSESNARGRRKTELRQNLTSLTSADRVFLESIGLLDLRGFNQIDTREELETHYEGDAAWFREALLRGGSFVNYRPQTAEEKPRLTFSTLVSSGDRPLSVLRSHYHPGVLHRILSMGEGISGPESFAVLLDRDNLILATSLHPITTGHPLFPGAFFPKVQTDQDGLTWVDLPYESDPPQVSARWAVAEVPVGTNGWRLLFLQSQQELLRPIHQQKRELILIACGVALAFGTIGCLAAIHLVAPIKELESAARQLILGKFNPRVITTRRDELGSLAKTFNQMADTLTLREKALRDSKEKAEVANQAKAEFLGVMSHEVRTPLNTILGFGTLLGDDPNLTPSQRDQLERIMAAARNLLQLLNNVLDYSRIERGDLQPISQVQPLREILQSATDLTTPLLRSKNVDLIVKVASNCSSLIETDAPRLIQILSNLLINAVKFTDEGYVVLRVSQQDKAPDPWLTFDVEDSGVGIPPTLRGRLFDAFVQADSSIRRSKGGVGLGLAIAYRLTKALRGTLEEIARPPGEGAHFRLTIPLTQIQAPPLLPARNDQKPTSPHHVAWFTTHPFHAQSYADLLQWYSFRVSIHSLDQPETWPDLTTVDHIIVDLPVVPSPGKEQLDRLVKALGSSRARVLIVAPTHLVTVQELFQSMKPVFLNKPLMPDDLLAALNPN